VGMRCVSNALHLLVTLTWCKDVVLSSFQNARDCREGCEDIEKTGTIFQLLWETQEVKWVLWDYDEYCFYHNDWREKL